ncbi:MAG: hypothetical protein U5K69_07715 [Balneolaceae bacterium]|nr:hypothetical protein [Balneolaceae bacterium]
MSVVKEKMKKIIESFPEDASYEEIMRELVFEQMVERGIKDVREERTLSNEEMKKSYSYREEIRWTAEAETWLKDIYDYIALDSEEHLKLLMGSTSGRKS